MTEYWKSNAKKFCEICKCWFADNRVSIEHHESGVRHKNAIQNKLRSLGQQSRKREEDDRDLRSTLAGMEVAALGSFKRDLKDQPSVAQQYNIQGSAMRIPVREAGRGSGPSKEMQQTLGPTFTPSFGGTSSYGGSASVSYESAPSHTASFDKVAVEMNRRMELAKQGKIPLASDPATLFSERSIGFSAPKREREKVWVEAVSPEGDTYYWHLYSGETMWEPPEDGYLLAEEHEAMLETQATLDEMNKVADQSGSGETVLPPPLNVAIKQPEPIVPRHIATLDDDEREEAVAAAEQEEDNYYEQGERLTEQEEEEAAKEEPPKVPKLTGCFVPGAVSYYTAPAVKPEPMPSFDRWAAAPIYDAPSPPDDEEEEPAMTDVKEAMFDEKTPAPLDVLLRKRRAEQQRAKDGFKEEAEEEMPEEKLKRLKQQDPVKPFGSWIVVKPTEKPEKVDLELPNASERAAAEPAVNLLPEERVRFKEKTVASVGKKKAVNSDGKSAPIEFKKRKTGAKSLRSRDDDED